MATSEEGGTGGQERDGGRKADGETLNLGNLCVSAPLQLPTSFFPPVCNIELFSKRMNVSCMVPLCVPH